MCGTRIVTGVVFSCLIGNDRHCQTLDILTGVALAVGEKLIGEHLVHTGKVEIEECAVCKTRSEIIAKQLIVGFGVNGTHHVVGCVNLLVVVVPGYLLHGPVATCIGNGTRPAEPVETAGILYRHITCHDVAYVKYAGIAHIAVNTGVERNEIETGRHTPYECRSGTGVTLQITRGDYA